MSSATLSYEAPAKINLFLRVVGKRPDGFHELETIFEFIDWSDTLYFYPLPTDLRLSCSDPSLPADDRNLVLRAARVLKEASGCDRGADIRLEKYLPHAAGLGGGSSDAATTLKALNRLWDLNWSLERLRPLAARLGADVPLFLHEGGFWEGTGRGDVVRPLEASTELAHVLVIPPVKLLTKDVFSADFGLTTPGPSITLMALALRNGSLSELASGVRNDLQAEAIRRCPVIQRIRNRLNQLGCLASCVSGSGPSVFGVCRDKTQADIIVQQLRQESDSDMRIKRVMTRFPLSNGK